MNIAVGLIIFVLGLGVGGGLVLLIFIGFAEARRLENESKKNNSSVVSQYCADAGLRDSCDARCRAGGAGRIHKGSRGRGGADRQTELR